MVVRLAVCEGSGSGDLCGVNTGSVESKEEAWVPGRGYREVQPGLACQHLEDAFRRLICLSARSLGEDLLEKIARCPPDSRLEAEGAGSWLPNSASNALGVRIPPQLLTLSGGAEGARLPEVWIPFQGEGKGTWKGARTPLNGMGPGGADAGALPVPVWRGMGSTWCSFRR
ncbi:hypothetical protein BT96DRAFT_948652 [Gymnopus androsaceus JB14]|uniref:Uncharacterized protein n=1 Tax=Gymnopus androsaceus JB14 TaxID=1447944 RepID=A0A6A4GMT8_9AGAR|nr:hypothetical protein BT96DRAFT_948652 [Gymnopus androsaceus JB14]